MGRWFCSRSICAKRAFLLHLCVLYLFTFVVILPLCCYTFRYSVYNYLQPHNIDKERDIMRQKNDLRLQAAKEFFRKYNETYLSAGTGGLHESNFHAKSLMVAVIVITVSRNKHKFDSYEPNYLTQVTAKFLQLFHENRDPDIGYNLFLCSVDENPKAYYELQNLSTFVETFHKYSNPDDVSSHTITTVYYLEKEKQDYIYCAQAALEKNVSYVFLVEDDALPYDDVLTVTNHVIKNHLEPKRAGSHLNMYVKFFHPQYVLGYISLEVERLPELASVSAVLATFLSLVYKYIFYKSSQRLTRGVWLGFFIYSCILFLCIGRPHLMELRRLSKFIYQITPSPSCCTPAILYSRDAAENLVIFFKRVTCRSKYAKDMALEDFRVRMNVTAKLVQPNLFEHIGMYSSLRDEVLNPYIV